MQARITRFKMKPEGVAEARTLMEGLRSEIMAQPGIRACLVAMNDDGSGHVVAMIGAQGGSPEAVDRVRMIWHRFHDLLESAPEPEIFDILADWRSDAR